MQLVIQNGYTSRPCRNRLRGHCAGIAVRRRRFRTREGPGSREAGDNVILITLDGARIEEMFGGMQVGILQSTLREGQKVEDSPLYRRFWAESPQARREKLMPFFWKTLMAEHGSIAGNPELGSSVG